MSLTNARVGAIIPVSSTERAEEFYGGLGLVAHRTPGGLELGAGAGTSVYLLEVPEAAGSGAWPIASFLVDDLDAVVDGLRAAGAAPVDTGAGFELDERGIARQDGMAVAWYRDPDGNIFTVFERSS